MARKSISFTPLMLDRARKGTKTVTRRAVGLRQVNVNPAHWKIASPAGWINEVDQMIGDAVRVKPPYAERLWVKETASYSYCLLSGRVTITYEDGRTENLVDHEAADQVAGWKFLLRKPAMYMPRWASRWELSVVSQKLVRLSDKLSQREARREGFGADRDFRRYLDTLHKPPLHPESLLWRVEYKDFRRAAQ